MFNYVVFDLETTGFSPESSEIIEIGAWKVESDIVVSKFSQLVRPSGYLPTQVQNLTHITSDMLKDAEGIDSVLPQFYDFCSDLPLLGHNLPFDYSFVSTKAKALGIDFTLNGQRQGIDTLMLARSYLPCQSHKLCDLADSLGIKVQMTDETQYHRASYDAYITKLVYDALKIKYSALRQVTVPYKLDEGSKAQYGEVKNNDTLSFE